MVNLLKLQGWLKINGILLESIAGHLALIRIMCSLILPKQESQQRDLPGNYGLLTCSTKCQKILNIGEKVVGCAGRGPGMQLGRGILASSAFLRKEVLQLPAQQDWSTMSWKRRCLVSRGVAWCRGV